MPWEKLKLTPEQRVRLANAVTRFQLDVPDTTGGFAGPNAAPAKNTGSVGVRAFRRELTRISAPNPFLTRLDQLFNQAWAAYNLGDTLARADVTAALNLTPTQLGRTADIEDEFIELAALVWHSSLTYEARWEVSSALRDPLEARTLDVLTPEQLAKWKELIGDPYPGFRKSISTGGRERSRY